MPANLKVKGDYTSPRVNCEEDFLSQLRVKVVFQKNKGLIVSNNLALRMSKANLGPIP